MQSPDLAIQYTIDGSSPLVVRLIQSQTVVGASSQADIRIESPFMSRRHFVIEQQNERLYVTDLGSSNGTTLQGRHLRPNTRQEWLPGQILSVANIRFELIAPQLNDTKPTVNSGGLVNLIADPGEIYAGEPSRITLNYNGSTAQMIYFRSDTHTDGLEISISPDQIYAAPGQAVMADVKTAKKKAYWTGGKFSVALIALTNSGEDVLTELIVKVRPRYELLLLFLLLLFAGGLGVATALPSIAAQLAPTATATLTQTASPTLTATNTATPTLTTTASATPTETATMTPSHTSTPTITPFPTSTQIPTREPTNTPFIITVIVPQVITVPVILPPIIITPPTPITPVVVDPQTACNGFVGRSPVDQLPNGPAAFYWDAPASGGAMSYGLSVTNLENGRSTSVSTNSGVTSATVDVSQNALGDGFSFMWQVTAQLIDGRPCTAPPISLRREAPLRDPDSSQGNCDDVGNNPCPDTSDTFTDFQASSILPDLTLFTQGSTDKAQALEAISNGVMFVFGMALVLYEVRRRRQRHSANEALVDKDER